MPLETPNLAIVDAQGQQGRIVDIRQIDPTALGIHHEILDETVLWRYRARQIDALKQFSCRDVKAPQPALANVQAHIGDPQAPLAVLGDPQGCINAAIAAIGRITLQFCRWPGTEGADGQGRKESGPVISINCRPEGTPSGCTVANTRPSTVAETLPGRMGNSATVSRVPTAGAAARSWAPTVSAAAMMLRSIGSFMSKSSGLSCHLAECQVRSLPNTACQSISQ